jgi:hypothetical protein
VLGRLAYKAQFGSQPGAGPAGTDRTAAPTYQEKWRLIERLLSARARSGLRSDLGSIASCKPFSAAQL